MKHQILLLSLILLSGLSQKIKAQHQLTTPLANTIHGTYSGQTILDEYGGSAQPPATIGFYNSFYGDRSGYNTLGGERNTFIGSFSGVSNVNGDGNIFLGYRAGYNETGSNKLYIDNSSTSSPLIWGDFSNNKLKFNGDVDITGGRLDVAGGIDVNDYIRHNGDNNTYFGFNGNDQFKIRTNNIDRLFINSLGRIGIGTTSPDKGKVHVYRNATTGSWGGITTDNAVLRLEDSNSSMFLDGNTIFSNGNMHIGPYSDSYLVFGTNDAERVRIAEDGKVGIGTNSPGHFLHVRGNPSEDDDRDVLAYFESSANSGQDVGIKIKGSRSASTILNAFVDFDTFDNNESTTTFTMGTIGAGKEHGDGINGQLRFLTNNDGALTEKMRIDKIGRVGIGTTSPDEKLSVIGKLSLANSEDETVDYLKLYHDGQANLSTSNGALHFRNVDEQYLVAEFLSATESRIHSVGKDLIFRARAIPATPDPADQADVFISATDGAMTMRKGAVISGPFHIENLDSGEENDFVLSLNEDGGVVKMRSVESLTPWVIRTVSEDLDILSCNPHAEGETCTCEPGTHITIDETDIIDIEGNLSLGLQGFIDNDLEAGPNVAASEYTDDFIRLQGSIEFSTANNNKGLVLHDHKSGTGHFLNLFNYEGISYFSNSTDGDVKTDYFMKVGTDQLAEKNAVSFSDKVYFENGFITPAYTSPDHMTFALDTDNGNNDALFQVGRGTTDPNDETNWFGLFSVDQTGLATFSSDIGDTENPYKVAISGSAGKVTASHEMVIGDESGSNHATITGATGSIALTGDLQSETVTARIAGGTENKAITVFNTTDNGEVFRVYNNGIVEAKEVLVSLDVWHDEVFEEDYSLMPVEELEAYVNENHHLPEVPAEEEVFNNGVKVGEMEAILLKKIEELTLYVIDQNKQLKEQMELIEAQAARIESLEQK